VYVGHRGIMTCSRRRKVEEEKGCGPWGGHELFMVGIRLVFSVVFVKPFLW